MALKRKSKKCQKAGKWNFHLFIHYLWPIFVVNDAQTAFFVTNKYARMLTPAKALGNPAGHSRLIS